MDLADTGAMWRTRDRADPETPKLRLVAGMAMVVAIVVLLTGCGSSGFHYVKSSNYHTYFKVPENWKLFSQDDVLAATKDLTPEAAAQ